MHEDRSPALHRIDPDAADHELDAIVAALSHDLRAPLRAIDGFSRILLADHAADLPEETRRFLALVRDAGTELADLLDDLVAIATVTRTPLEPREVDPALLARELVDAIFTPRAFGRDVTWTIEDVPAAQADQVLTRRLLEEVMDNALKFTAPKASAHIRLSWDDEAGAYALRDDGIGLPGAFPEQAFAIFGRLQTREAFGGTGAGLAIAERIATRHGGRVWGEGAPGEGATVWFTLG